MGPRLCVHECATLVSSRMVCTTYTYMYNWGEPERAPHRRVVHARIVFICMYVCTVAVKKTLPFPPPSIPFERVQNGAHTAVQTQ